MLNPLTNYVHHIETSRLVCSANQLFGSFMTGLQVQSIDWFLHDRKSIVDEFKLITKTLS